jgi:hypothetical protein
LGNGTKETGISREYERGVETTNSDNRQLTLDANTRHARRTLRAQFTPRRYKIYNTPYSDSEDKIAISTNEC